MPLAWHVVNTRPNQEIRAAVELTRQDFQVFFPVIRSKPLFPRYIFTQFDRDGPGWGVIKSTRGCCDVLKNGFRPVIVRQPIMDAILAYSEPQDAVEPLPNFITGQLVTIRNGLLRGYEGLFQGTDKQRTKAFLEILGNRIEIPISDLTPTVQSVI